MWKHATAGEKEVADSNLQSHTHTHTEHMGRPLCTTAVPVHLQPCSLSCNALSCNILGPSWPVTVGEYLAAKNPIKEETWFQRFEREGTCCKDFTKKGVSHMHLHAAGADGDWWPGAGQQSWAGEGGQLPGAASAPRTACSSPAGTQCHMH